MIRRLHGLLWLCAAGLLTGCGTTEGREINYATVDVQVRSQAMLDGAAFTLQAFEFPGSSDPLVVYGPYRITEPVVDFVRDGLAFELTSRGATVERGQLAITGIIEEIEEADDKSELPPDIEIFPEEPQANDTLVSNPGDVGIIPLAGMVPGGSSGEDPIIEVTILFVVTDRLTGDEVMRVRTKGLHLEEGRFLSSFSRAVARANLALLDSEQFVALGEDSARLANVLEIESPTPTATKPEPPADETVTTEPAEIDDQAVASHDDAELEGDDADTQRAMLTQAFEDGQLSPEQFSSALAEIRSGELSRLLESFLTGELAVEVFAETYQPTPETSSPTPEDQ